MSGGGLNILQKFIGSVRKLKWKWASHLTRFNDKQLSEWTLLPRKRNTGKQMSWCMDELKAKTI